jgi:hypothetical protein
MCRFHSARHPIADWRRVHTVHTGSEPSVVYRTDRQCACDDIRISDRGGGLAVAARVSKIHNSCRFWQNECSAVRDFYSSAWSVSGHPMPESGGTCIGGDPHHFTARVESVASVFRHARPSTGWSGVHGWRRIDRPPAGWVGPTALMLATRARTSGGKTSSYGNGGTDLNLRVR